MDAREYFDSVRTAVRARARCLARVSAMRAREGLRGASVTAMRGGGTSDPMGATDARVDAEREARAEVSQLDAEIAAARAVCRGVRESCPSQRWGDVLELRYCEDLSVAETAAALSISARSAARDTSAALDFVDSIGIACARAGMGAAS